MERKAREWSLTMLPVGNHELRNDWMTWTPKANLCPLPTKKKNPRSKKQGSLAYEF
ncbi:MAG: hypothetical protein R3E93_08755 [Thiothrix sp.]